MLWTIIVILAILGLLGLGPLSFLSSFAYALLVIAAVLVVVQLLTGKRAVS